MTYRFVHPLYDERDLDNAVEYMANAMTASGKFIIQSGDNDSNVIDNSAVSEIIKGFIKNSMGNHVVEIANFSLVQDKFYEIYADAYQDFLKYANIDHCITYFTGGGIMLPFILSKMHDKIAGQINPYNPKANWDLLKSRRTPMQDLSNPINGHHDVTLYINNCKNCDFISEAFCLSREFNQKDSFDPKKGSISFRLLPNSDYLIIQRVLKLLHKHF